MIGCPAQTGAVDTRGSLDLLQQLALQSAQLEKSALLVPIVDDNDEPEI